MKILNMSVCQSISSASQFCGFSLPVPAGKVITLYLDSLPADSLQIIVTCQQHISVNIQQYNHVVEIFSVSKEGVKSESKNMHKIKNTL